MNTWQIVLQWKGLLLLQEVSIYVSLVTSSGFASPLA